MTGATGLLGQAIVQRFSMAGFDVAVHFRSDENTATELVDSVKLLRQKAIALEADFATENIDELADAVVATADEQLGGLSTVVLNASAQDVVAWDQLTADSWDSMYVSSLRATASLIRAASNLFAKSDVPNKTIIVIGSIEGIRPASGHAPYAVMKAAMHHLVAAAAHELGPKGIRVIGVAPGLVDSEKVQTEWPEGVERFNKVAALGRPVTTNEVANLVTFLATPAASGITGVTIPVDAGWSAHPGW